MEKIIFICTGNTCRSPMAAALMRRALPGASISSAGVYAAPGARPSAEAVAVMREMGIDISGHRARKFTCGMADGAVLVPMTHGHEEMLRAMCPGARVVRFLDGADVPDPFGGSTESYRKTAFLLESAVERLAKRLDLR
jgi:protein-tyrosine-phosphatase